MINNNNNNNNNNRLVTGGKKEFEGEQQRIAKMNILVATPGYCCCSRL